jgi:hypothetical protein
MGRSNRASTTAIVLVCLLAAPRPDITVFASDEEAASGATRSAPPTVMAPVETLPRLVIDPAHFTLADESSTFAQRRGGFRGRGRGRSEGARTAVVVGALAAVAGAALLVYANRPECRGNASANACGYGTRVIGGAVLTAGAVGIVAGTISWR